MLLRLSGLMRHTLDRTQEPLLLLDAELEFTRQYVDLQQARFADRLQVTYAIDDSCRSLLVPTFLFQPLVENAIRHGAGGRVQPCHLEIGARLVPGALVHVWVSDDGAGLEPGFDLARNARTGLGNIRSRLQQLYGSAGQISVAARDGGGTRVDIQLPVTPAVRAAEASA
jgi:LytS/YehU family sensor histidine kinase